MKKDHALRMDYRVAAATASRRKRSGLHETCQVLYRSLLRPSFGQAGTDSHRLTPKHSSRVRFPLTRSTASTMSTTSTAVIYG